MFTIGSTKATVQFDLPTMRSPDSQRKNIQTIILMESIVSNNQGLDREQTGDDRWPPRRLILLDGDHDWGLRTAVELIAERQPTRLVWVSHLAIPKAMADLIPGETLAAIPPTKVQRLLGGECDLLLIDLWSGLDADALGAAVGSLRGGGLLLLLTPRLADWPSWVDPEAARIAVHPYAASEVGTRFIARFARLLQTSAVVERVEGPGPEHRIAAQRSQASDQPSAVPKPERMTVAREPTDDWVDDPINRWPDRAASGKTASAAAVADTDAANTAGAADSTDTVKTIAAPRDGIGAAPTLTQPATSDQAEAVAAIHALAMGRARRPLVLTADRGRGKSAALGLAAGRLIAEQRLQIIVSAPRRSAVDTLFEHARAILQAAAAAETDPLLHFEAPDALLATSPSADLLLIDEAAGIPAPLLEQLLIRYPRICFATTVHGYEGTGRGFDLRFRALLDQRTPSWRALRLKTPIRWCQDDPLEQFINQVLLLDAEPATDAQVAAADCASARFAIQSPETLATDDALLGQLFGLLVLGHYQTRPNDLRHLLDGPNLEVATLSVSADINASTDRNGDSSSGSDFRGSSGSSSR